VQLSAAFAVTVPFRTLYTCGHESVGIYLHRTAHQSALRVLVFCVRIVDFGGVRMYVSEGLLPPDFLVLEMIGDRLLL